MVEIQKELTIKYRNLFGLSKLIVSNSTPDIIFADNVLNDSAYIVKNCEINKNLSVNSSLYVERDMTCKDMLITNNITVSNNSYLNNLTLNNLCVSSSCFIKNDTIIKGTSIHNNITQMESLNTNTLICNTVNTDHIYQKDDVININGNSIIIGTDKSTINIIGNLSYISSSNLKIADKLITLNDPNKLTNNYYGIEILGISGNGYIRTLDNGRYEIKAPLNKTKQYIVEVDMDENINISGTALLHNNVTVSSNISILQDVVYNSVDANNLNISSKTICNNYYSNNINISGVSYILNDMTTEKLTVKNITMNNLTVLSMLNINGTCNIKSNVTLNSDLLINNTLLVKNNMTVLADLKVNLSMIINNNLTVNSNLFVSSNTLLNNNVSAYALNVQKDTIINNSLNLTSKLTISKNISIKGNVTLNNSFISGNIIIPLQHYDTNYTAALNNVQKWGLYRTGGIVKIRLDILPPDITLIGNSPSYMTVGMAYLELGATALDNDDTGISTYITSIKKDFVEYLNNPVLVLPSTYISTTTPLNTIGTYTIVYNASDTIGNIGIKNRTLLISA